MLYLTLEYAGTEKSFADWGISLGGAVCTHRNLESSRYVIQVPGGNIGADPLFDFEAQVIIRRGRMSADGAPDSFSDGYTAFVGYAMNPEESNQPLGRGVRYTFVNAWYWLEITPFQQSTASWTGTGTPVKSYPFTSDVTLFTRMGVTDGVGSNTKITNGEQVHDILQHLLDYLPAGMAAPYEIGEIQPAVDVPEYQIQEVNCVQAIQKCLELSPDALVIWDYTTTPPTVSVRSKPNLTPVTLAIANGVDHKSLNILPRWDLIPASVVIYWRITYGDSLSTTRVGYVTERWGPGGANTGPVAGPGVLVLTFNLRGATYTRMRAYLRCRTCYANTGATDNADRLAWWALHHRPFANVAAPPIATKITDLTITNATLTDESLPAESADVTSLLSSLPYELLDGMIAPGMAYSSFGIEKRTVRVDATASYKVKAKAASGNFEVTVREEPGAPLSCRIVLTNFSTGWYQLFDSSAGDDDFIYGIARAVYESMCGNGASPVPEYQGEHVLVESQATGQISMANTLCLSGGRAEWETMCAMIQSITEDDGLGETSVSIGPAPHLDAAGLRAVGYFNRQRLMREPTKTQRATGLG